MLNVQSIKASKYEAQQPSIKHKIKLRDAKFNRKIKLEDTNYSIKVPPFIPKIYKEDYNDEPMKDASSSSSGSGSDTSS